MVLTLEAARFKKKHKLGRRGRPRKSTRKPLQKKSDQGANADQGATLEASQENTASNLETGSASTSQVISTTKNEVSNVPYARSKISPLNSTVMPVAHQSGLHPSPKPSGLKGHNAKISTAVSSGTRQSKRVSPRKVAAPSKSVPPSETVSSSETASPHKSVHILPIAAMSVSSAEHIEIPIIMMKPSFESRVRQYKCVKCGTVFEKISQYEDHWVTHGRTKLVSSALVGTQNDNSATLSTVEPETSLSEGGDKIKGSSFRILDKEISNPNSNEASGSAFSDTFLKQLKQSVEASHANIQTEEVMDEGSSNNQNFQAIGNSAGSFKQAGTKRNKNSPLEHDYVLPKKVGAVSLGENMTVDLNKLTKLLNIDNVLPEIGTIEEFSVDDPSFSVQEVVVTAEESESGNIQHCESASGSDDDSQMENLISLATDLEDRIEREKNREADSGIDSRNQQTKLPLSYSIEPDADDESVNVFVCNHCQKTFKFFTSLKRHHECIHEDMNQDGYECDVCSKKFDKQFWLISHKKRMHSDKKTDDFGAQCDICDKVFAHASSLKLHKLLHTNVKPFKCTICRTGFKRQSGLKSHMQWHQKMTKMKYKCPHCWWATDRQNPYKIHVASHEGNKYPFDCKLCDKRFTTVSNWKAHNRLHNNTYQIICQYCGKDFKQSCNYTRHLQAIHKVQEVKKNFYCDCCSRSFYCQSSFEDHYRTHKETSSLKCKECDELFLNRYLLSVHTRIVHRGICHTCGECGKQFAWEGKYLAHLRMHKMQSLNYFCQNCNRTFRSQGLLNNHLANKECPKRKCKKCNVYVDYASLEQHRKCHVDISKTINKPCFICGLHLKTLQDVFEHCLEHAGIKPEDIANEENDSQAKENGFVPTRCQICGQEFRVLSQLVDHVVRHEISEESPVKCGVCSDVFVQPEAYIEHLGSCFEETSQVDAENHATAGESFLHDFEPATMVAMKNSVEPDTVDGSSKNSEQEDTQNTAEEDCEDGADNGDCKNDDDDNVDDGVDSSNDAAKMDEDAGINCVCVLCLRASSTISHIKLHLWSRCTKVVDTRKCWGCYATFESKSLLLEHFAETQGACVNPDAEAEANSLLEESLFQCEYCEKKFIGEDWRDAHVGEYHVPSSHECEECGETFRFAYEFKMHRKSMHEKRKGEYNCLACDKPFYHRWKLAAHLKEHQYMETKSGEAYAEYMPNNINLSPSKQKQIADRTLGHRCELCERVLSSALMLSNHKAVEHGIGRSSCVCGHCDRQFLTSQNLKAHIRVHTNEKPYECEQCPKRFAQYTNMRRHSMTHFKDAKRKKK
eukprot:gene18087-19894_t